MLLNARHSTHTIFIIIGNYVKQLVNHIYEQWVERNREINEYVGDVHPTQGPTLVSNDSEYMYEVFNNRVPLFTHVNARSLLPKLDDSGFLPERLRLLVQLLVKVVRTIKFLTSNFHRKL